jgi:hypothetical protein
MNDRDRLNLEFLLSLKTKEDWEAFAKAVGPDDLEYAMEILQEGLLEITESPYEYDYSYFDYEINDFTEANAVIKKAMYH